MAIDAIRHGVSRTHGKGRIEVSPGAAFLAGEISDPRVKLVILATVLGSGKDATSAEKAHYRAIVRDNAIPLKSGGFQLLSTRDAKQNPMANATLPAKMKSIPAYSSVGIRHARKEGEPTLRPMHSAACRKANSATNVRDQLCDCMVYDPENSSYSGELPNRTTQRFETIADFLQWWGKTKREDKRAWTAQLASEASAIPVDRQGTPATILPETMHEWICKIVIKLTNFLRKQGM